MQDAPAGFAAIPAVVRGEGAFPQPCAARVAWAAVDEAPEAQIAYWADTGALFVAWTCAYRGNHDHALRWLDRAYSQRDQGLQLDNWVGKK